jgi:hypothetical protein
MYLPELLVHLPDLDGVGSRTNLLNGDAELGAYNLKCR